MSSGLLILEVAICVLALLPLAMTCANLNFYRPPAPATGRPSVSVLIPARNEEANIADACAAVLASIGVIIELIVLDDHSTDRTRTIVEAIPDRRLSVHESPPLPPGWSGKQHACAALAQRATHELMVFVDADVRLAPDAVARMAGYMQRNDVGLASGFPRELTGTWAETLLIPLIHFLLLGFLPVWMLSRSSSPGLGAGCGQLFIVRQEAYRRAGGHSAIRASLHDGLTLPRAFRNAGIMTGLFDASSFVSCRMYHNAAEVWEGLSKNATEGMARPVALPIWTVILFAGHVLPLLLLALGPAILPALALMFGIATRIVLALRFRQSFISALVHPAGITALLALQWVALVRSALGRPAMWRGRAYSAQ